MNMVRRISTTMCIVILAVSIGAYIMFGWSGSGWKALSVPTGSMRPTIPPGSLVFVHRVPHIFIEDWGHHYVYRSVTF